MIEDLTPMQMARRFDAEHGPASEQDGSWIYYPDGARREVNPLGAYMAPPTDKHERAAAAVHYHQIKVARLVAAFDDVKREATTLAKHPTSSYDHAKTTRTLRAMRAEVQQARTDLAEAEEALRFARTGRTLEEEARLAQAEADMAEERERQRKELEGINV